MYSCPSITQEYKRLLKGMHTLAPVQWQQSAPLCPGGLPSHSQRPHVYEAML